MDQLADSSGLVDDAAGLRARLAADGYLFFRSLLPPAAMRATGAAVAAQLGAGGWVSGDGTPAGPASGRHGA